MGDWADFFDEKRIPIDSGKRKIGEYPYYGATGIIDYVDGYIFDGEYVLLAEDGANITMRNSPIAYLTEGKFWLNNHAHIMRMKDGSNRFLLQLLEQQNYEKYNSGTAQPKLNGQVLKKIILYFPSKDEQTKIGNFFEKLENLITANQARLEKLRKLKNGYLQHIFGHKIRFKGYSKPWEKSKLGDLTDIFDGTHQTPDYKPEGIPFLSVENIKDLITKKFISKEDFKRDFKNPPVKGDVLMTRIGDIGTARVVDNDGPIAYYVSLALLKPKDSDSNFLVQAIESVQGQAELWKRTLHIAFPKKINKNEISKVVLSAPNKEEQTKIGEFFKILDALIDAHQSKIGKLKMLKKSYLEQMLN